MKKNQCAKVAQMGDMGQSIYWHGDSGIGTSRRIHKHCIGMRQCVTIQCIRHGASGIGTSRRIHKHCIGICQCVTLQYRRHGASDIGMARRHWYRNVPVLSQTLYRNAPACSCIKGAMLVDCPPAVCIGKLRKGSRSIMKAHLTIIMKGYIFVVKNVSF